MVGGGRGPGREGREERKGDSRGICGEMRCGISRFGFEQDVMREDEKKRKR